MSDNAKKMISTILERARLEAGGIANLAREAGAPRTTMSAWVNGDLPAALLIFWRVCEYLGEPLASATTTDERVAELEAKLAEADAREKERARFYEDTIRALTSARPGVEKSDNPTYNEPQEIASDPDAGGDSVHKQPTTAELKSRGGRKRGTGTG